MAGRYDTAQAVLDLPTAFYFRQMMHLYPSAKFILTVRTADQWYDSIRLSIEASAAKKGGMPSRVKRLYETVFGSANVNKRQTWIDAYIKHNDDVRSTVPAHQLLELDVQSSDAMIKLCEFLHVHTGPCDSQHIVNHGGALTLLHTSEEAEEADTTNKWQPIHFETHTQFAYVSLLANPSAADQREYFLSFLIAVESIRQSGSTHDVVALIYGEIGDREKRILEHENIKQAHVGTVGSALPSSIYIPMTMGNLSSATLDVYRAKITMLKLLDYDMVLFLDADSILLQNIDAHFIDIVERKIEFFAFDGSRSPLNAGFMFAKPSWQAYIDIDDISSTYGFNAVSGWLDCGPIPDWREHINPLDDDDPDRHTRNWLKFHKAHAEQGLLYYYYMCYHKGIGEILHFNKWTDKFTHFMGKNKPYRESFQNIAADKLPKRWRPGIQLWQRLKPDIETRISKYFR